MTAHAEAAIERYFDGSTFSPTERDALFGHMDRCASCRSYFDEVALAHRALTGRKNEVPSTELALIGRSMIDSVVGDRERAERSWSLRGFVGALGALAALVLAVVSLGEQEPDYLAKGSAGVAPALPVVEALCFDENAEIVSHLKSSGTCPTPGFVKLVFASPRSVEELSVAVASGEELLSLENLRSPEPRSVLPGHVRLEPGKVLRIVVREGPLDGSTALSSNPSLTVEGGP